jgi:hypothetical protein
VLEQVSVIRYVTPLREGGSLPALVEADNFGTYVMKFRGAGQGPKALVAEIIEGNSPVGSACARQRWSSATLTRASRAASLIRRSRICCARATG